jgi:hypothetical protein
MEVHRGKGSTQRKYTEGRKHIEGREVEIVTIVIKQGSINQVIDPLLSDLPLPPF